MLAAHTITGIKRVSDHYTVIGATSGPGLGVFLKLAQSRQSVVGVARDTGRINQVEAILKTQNLSSAKLIQIDLQGDEPLAEAVLQDTTHLIGASRAPFIQKLAVKMPNLQYILSLGSTRIFTRYPDQRKAEMQEMVDFLANQTIPHTILHPSLIYGGTGYNNVERIRSLLRFLPLIPLPSGGKALIQPVHNDDVVRAVLAALANPKAINKTIVIAGPKAIRYADFIQAIGKHIKKKAICFSLPLPLLIMLADLTRIIPLVPSIGSMEILRLSEDKDFSIAEMQDLLGVRPIPVEEGLKIFYSLDEVSDHFARF